MFETHFGLSGPPFQLSPDPAFYFDSRGHANALAYLKFGVYQSEGFIVVTGEVGAGKTTLVRALLESLDSAQVVAAQVVTTQLEAGDLLRAITAAFGIAPSSRGGKADLILSLESFLTALATTNRRALLIVDEAQNLSIEAIEELRMLSNFQLGNRALLQSFLVGQPELRAMLESPSMEQFRQRVIASCHLGPLDPAETRAYIEHRLRRVGWVESPTFDADAFDEIHVHTGGIPRRINQLCNRLLLAAFLTPSTTITRTDVKRISRELLVEVGERHGVRKAGTAPARAQVSRTAHHWVLDEQQTAAISTDTGVVQVVNQRGLPVERPILCLATSAASFAAIGVLARAIAKHPELPQVIAVNPGQPQDVSFGDGALTEQVCAAMEMHLGVLPPSESRTSMADLAPRIEALVTETSPRALLTIDSDEPSLVGALIARSQGVPVLRLRAGVRTETGLRGLPWGALIDRVADVLFTDSAQHTDTLSHEALPASRVAYVGSLKSNLLHAMRAHLPPPASVLARQGVARVAPGRYVLVVAQYGIGDERQELINLVSALARRAPTIWLASEASMAALLAHGLYGRVTGDGVVLLPATSYLDSLAVLNGAGCVVRGGDESLAEEIDALGLPSVMLHTAFEEAGTSTAPAGVAMARNADEALCTVEAILGFGAGNVSAKPVLDDAAGRIANHLRTWFRAQAPREIQTLTDSVTSP